MKASVRTALFNTAYVYVMPKEKHSKKKRRSRLTDTENKLVTSGERDGGGAI